MTKPPELPPGLRAAPAASAFPRFRGTLSFTPTDREAMAEDFGHLRHASPAAVLAPADADDLQRLVAFARAHRFAVAARGQGHAMGGQPLAPGGVVVDMRSLGTVGPVDRDARTVRVGAGATWDEVVLATLREGLVPPALTDFLGLSVGGTLSLAGIGGQSFRFGAQIDNVVAFDVVTGAGELFTASPNHEPELFDACLGGLGQHGILTSTELALVPAPVRVRTFEALYTTAEPFLALSLLACERGLFDYVAGMVVPLPAAAGGGFGYLLQLSLFDGPDLPGRLTTDEARAFFQPAPAHLEVIERDAFAFLNRSALQRDALQAAGVWGVPHPWITQFLPEEQAGPFLAELVAAGGRDLVQLIGEGYLAVYPLLRPALRRPTLRVPSSPRMFLIGLLPNALPATDERVAELLSFGRELYENGQARGGRLYPIGLLPRSSEWPHVFGDAWDTFVRRKRRFDPDGILTPGPGIVVS
jgi:cytokinin dehydrogenase